MPVDEQEWTERPAERLRRLEDTSAKNTHNIERLTEAVEGIQHTLATMASEEIAELRKRAELPRKILVAVMTPVVIAVITAVALTLVGHIHVG